MTPENALRTRIIGALLDSAVTDTDLGGAGYSMGMADNFRDKIGPGRHLEVDYAERVEAGVRRQLESVIGFHREGHVLRATFASGRSGARVEYDSPLDALAAHRRLSALRAGNAPPPPPRSA